jgi:hypothetical protein
MMYPAPEQVRQRQQAMLDMATEERNRLRLRRLGRARRRVERAERRLVEDLIEASQLNADLADMEQAQRF